MCVGLSGVEGILPDFCFAPFAQAVQKTMATIINDIQITL
jgi:hypothetical protein